MQRARRIWKHFQHVILLSLAVMPLRGIQIGIALEAGEPLLLDLLRIVALLALLGLLHGGVLYFRHRHFFKPLKAAPLRRCGAPSLRTDLFISTSDFKIATVLRSSCGSSIGVSAIKDA